MKTIEKSKNLREKAMSSAPAQLDCLLTNKPEHDGWCSHEFATGCILSNDEEPAGED